MLRSGALALILAGGAATSACASNGWKQLREEYPAVRADCGLGGTSIERDATDKRLLRLVFRQRYNARLQASRDGSLDCVEQWARERGWRVTTAPAGAS